MITAAIRIFSRLQIWEGFQLSMVQFRDMSYRRTSSRTTSTGICISRLRHFRDEGKCLLQEGHAGSGMRDVQFCSGSYNALLVTMLFTLLNYNELSHESKHLYLGQHEPDCHEETRCSDGLLRKIPLGSFAFSQAPEVANELMQELKLTSVVEEPS